MTKENHYTAVCIFCARTDKDVPFDREHVIPQYTYAYQKGQTWVIDYGPNTLGIDPGADCDDSEPEEEDG